MKEKIEKLLHSKDSPSNKLTLALELAIFFSLEEDEAWINFELNGYTDEELLPEYRIIEVTHDYTIRSNFQGTPTRYDGEKKINYKLLDPVDSFEDLYETTVDIDGLTYHYSVDEVIKKLNIRIREFAIQLLKSQQSLKTTLDSDKKSLETLKTICSNFSTFISLLKTKINTKQVTEPISDNTVQQYLEYDIQYYFRAILHLFFSDINIEEPNPSLGGSSTKVEFFLRADRIFLEIKVLRDNGKVQKEEILADIPQYGKRTDIDHIIFYVYCKSDKFINKVGFAKDIKEAFPNFPKNIEVIIT